MWRHAWVPMWGTVVEWSKTLGSLPCEYSYLMSSNENETSRAVSSLHWKSTFISSYGLYTRDIHLWTKPNELAIGLGARASETKFRNYVPWRVLRESCWLILWKCIQIKYCLSGSVPVSIVRLWMELASSVTNTMEYFSGTYLPLITISIRGPIT
jgi:hypothetical protein